MPKCIDCTCEKAHWKQNCKDFQAQGGERTSSVKTVSVCGEFDSDIPDEDIYEFMSDPECSTVHMYYSSDEEEYSEDEEQPTMSLAETSAKEKEMEAKWRQDQSLKIEPQ